MKRKQIKKFIKNTLRKIEAPPRSSLYWAYGANLNVEAMRHRCPGAKKIGRLALHYGRLTFRGVADCELVDDPDAVIQGGIWRITRQDEDNLDHFEGFPHGYTKSYLRLKVNGREERAMFYRMNLREGEEVYQGPPYGGYYEGIVQGYRDFGLDEACLIEALERSWDKKNWSPRMRRRWEEKGEPSLTRVTYDEGEDDEES
jgi:gamma-glutamylcyclotransferase (GGCT)/AIG2-like uncharacterized protein YtfP